MNLTMMMNRTQHWTQLMMMKYFEHVGVELVYSFCSWTIHCLRDTNLLNDLVNELMICHWLLIVVKRSLLMELCSMIVNVISILERNHLLVKSTLDERYRREKVKDNCAINPLNQLSIELNKYLFEYLMRVKRNLLNFLYRNNDKDHVRQSRNRNKVKVKEFCLVEND